MVQYTTSTAALHGKRLKGRLSSQVPFLFHVSFLQCCSTIIIINTMSSSLASSLCCIGCNALHTLDITLQTFAVVVVFEAPNPPFGSDLRVLCLAAL